MKGKEMKQAKLHYVAIEFNEKGEAIRKRPLTFDFNALCELSDLFVDPIIAVTGIMSGDPKVIRSVLYASLVAGQLAVDENVEFDLSIAKVGNLIGPLVTQFHTEYEDIMTKILEGVTMFFPDKEEPAEAEKTEEDPKN